MSNRAQVCAWFVALGLCVPLRALAQERTEQEVVALIVRDSAQLHAIRAEVEVTRREQDARRTWPNPLLQYSRESAGLTEFLQVEQALPAFGVRAALSRVGVAAIAAVEADRDARVWRLRAEASDVVARLLAEQARVAAGEALVGEIQRLVDVMRVREREGEGSRFDRVRAEQEWREAKAAATAAAVARSDALASVAALLPADVPLTSVRGELQVRSLSTDVEHLLARANDARAELRALQSLELRAAQEAEAARKARGPAPTVFGGWKRAATEVPRENGSVFGLSLSLPLFDTGSREAARWSAERARVTAEREVLRHVITRDVRRAFEAVTLRQAAAHADVPGAAAELVEMADVAYREGETGVLELLDAVRTAARARVRTIELHLEARLAEIALERAVGEVLWP